MTDALIELLKISLPGDILVSLGDELSNVQNCEFEKLLQNPLIQFVLGKQRSETTDTFDPPNTPLWSDFIEQRLDSILTQKRGISEDSHEENPQYEQYLFLLLALASLNAFLQSNVTGPPLSFSVTEALFPKKIVSDQTKLPEIRSELILSLTVDGVAAYKLTPNIELFCLANAIIQHAPVLGDVNVARWIKLRTEFAHQKLLSEVAPSLQSSIYSNLDTVESFLHSVENNSLRSEIYVEYLLERSAVHTHHGLDKKARADIEEAAKRRKFEFALTGLLGKRTRYQQKETSQLVVLARSAETLDSRQFSQDDGISTSQTETRAVSDGNKHIEIRPKNLDLNDDTLLESISFSDTQPTSVDVQDEDTLPSSLRSLDPSNQPKLAPLDSIILLALASSITNTSPAHGLTREETLPYATRVVEGGSPNWQVYTQALLVRSRIEGYKSRTTERGLLQLQALVDQVIAETEAVPTSTNGDIAPTQASTFLPRPKESESAPASERLRYIFQLASPTRWELEAELAARWVQLGGLRSALEIYERLEMWAEAALCWAATEREEKAKKVVRRQLFHASTGDDIQVDLDEEKWEGPARDPPPADAPRLYCILGDIDQETRMYEKAWEVSNRRYARAQRSLGRHYFAAKDYVKAAAAYSASLQVNHLNQTSWFALGCALLELEAYNRAAQAFTKVVQLDDTDAEAWSNLAAALLHIEESTETPPTTDTNEDKLNQSDDITSPHSPRNHKRDALHALKNAAKLKNTESRIWENLLTVSASLSPPSYADIATSMRRLIALRGASAGESCIDAPILDMLLRHVIAETGVYEPQKRGLQRIVLELVDTQVQPLITSSRQLWQIVARAALWRNRPGAALEATEKAWRAVLAVPGWEYGSEMQWGAVVEATVELVDAYENLGPRERTEGLSAGSGEVVARDWRFKGRSAVRSVLGRGKDGFEGTPGWERLEGVLEGLRGKG
ncbi:TPR-like protein [Patellaria atrata CBS 101060]|uniref:TPR-like protein n=1 Tax=Patellaria atrata CBS 101060 TaxID=1346257 RepID=A0A9P4S726_9PEZI|nr:TPR-like protein [Patellaria atrata CBS 101060]